MTRRLRLLDPYEIPLDLVPPGMTYQWISKKSLGEIDPHYQTILDAGWRPVPYARLARHYQGKYQDPFGDILIGGQILMERALEASKVARDKEMDKAVINANSGRDIAVDLVSRIKLSAYEIESASKAGLSSGQYAQKRINEIAKGVDFSYLSGWNGSLQFQKPPVYYKPRHWSLRWLFNLIAKEDMHDDRRY